MVQYIKIVNWERYQHYTKRRPPWIKLYRDLLRDREFNMLPDAKRYHFIGLLLLAAYHQNLIPYDVPYIRREINAKSRIDFTRLFDSGLIELCQRDALPIPEDQKTIGSEDRCTEDQRSNEERSPLPFSVSYYSRVVFDILEIKQIFKKAEIEHPRHLDKLAHQVRLPVDRFAGMIVQVVEFPTKGQPKKIKSYVGYTIRVIQKNNGMVLASDPALDFIRSRIKDYENQCKEPPAAICHKCALNFEEATDPDDWYWDDQIGWLCPACESKPEDENAW